MPHLIILLHRHRLRQIPRHIDIIPKPDRNLQCQQLRDDHHLEKFKHRMAVVLGLDEVIGQIEGAGADG